MPDTTPTNYKLYSMDVVSDPLEGADLSHGGLVLIALLSGGDYSPGLDSCGLTISLGLARCGFGDRLVHAVNYLEHIKLEKELESITHDIKVELQKNTSGFLDMRYPRLAAKFTVEHIAPDKVSMYLNPVKTAPKTHEWILRCVILSSWCYSTLNLD